MAVKQAVSTSGLDDNRFHYGYLEHDPETATEHAGNRQYDSAVGIWMSMDPYAGSYDFNDPQSLDRYAYARNNPAAFTDPTGRDWTLIVNVWEHIGASFGLPSVGGAIVTTALEFTGIGAAIGIAADLILGDLFKPQFHGSLRPRPNAPNNAEAKACEARILNATNSQFGTEFNSGNVTGEFQYSTGAPLGQGTLNLDITGSQAAYVSAGRYPLHWWSYIVGYGDTLHVPSGAGGADSYLTLAKTSSQFTAHLDSAYPYGVGFMFHYLLDMKGLGGHKPCP